MVDYVIWDSEDVPDACALQKFEGVEDPWEIAEGAPGLPRGQRMLL